MSQTTVGVVGAGVIGIGVAQCFASAGYRVAVLDHDSAALEKAQQELRNNIRMQRLLSGGNGSLSVDEVVANVEFTGAYASLANASLVVENVTEDFDAKAGVYAELNTACTSDCLFAVNTSCISISRIGAIVSGPQRVIGAHFMNPPPLKKTVEVILGENTSESTRNRLGEFLTSIGKDMIVVKDSPGFVSNRVLMPTINEAIALVHEGVSAPEDIDRLFRSCFGHKMGPLETADLIGLDTVLASIEVLHESFQADHYAPCPLLVEMVNAETLGRKTGKGFYSYGAAQ